MIIICTAIFAWILASKCGMQWEGAAAAWLLAAIMDAGLLALLIFRLTEKSSPSNAEPIHGEKDA